MDIKPEPEEKKKIRARHLLAQADKRIIAAILILSLLIIALAVWIAIANKALTVSSLSVESARLPYAFDGYRIAHVSDLHNTEIGKNNEKLLAALRESEPDIIAITGDLIDSRKTDVDISLAFAAEAVRIAPCYYAPGNHEARVPEEYELLREGLTDLGVTVLENEAVTLKNGEAEIDIFGVYDPRFYRDSISRNEEWAMEQLLDRHTFADGKFTLMLSHRPEFFELYTKYPVDLVLSGHAHGGQFRLPLIGGLYAPHQGAFPKYDAGIFETGGTAMIVSRGIGNSAFPFRINNRPELMIVELTSSHE